MNILTLLLYTFITGLVLFYVSFNKRNRRPGRLPPGPTPWPIVGNLPNLSSAMHHSLASLAKKYGPLMYLRLGFLDVVVVSSSYVAEQFLKVHDGNFASRPPNSGAKYIGYNYQDMVFAPYGPRWRMLRKICSSHLFSPKTLDDFRRVRQEEVRILTRILVDAKNSPVKLGKLLSMCTANTLTQMMLGRRVFDSQSEGSEQKADEFKDMVVELMVLAGEINISDFIPPLECLDLQGLIKKMKKLHDRFDLFLNKIIEEHKTGKDNAFGHTDLLTTLISLKDDADGEGGKLTDIEIKALLLNLFVGGTDSSSLTVEWALAELISHPKLLKQAREEIDNVVGRDRLVTELDVSQLTFLQAVVKETFRLHPPAALSLPRIASESCEVNGYYIPKGSTLLINVWAIARDPKVWTDPLKFQPSRFLPGGEKPGVDVKVNDFEVMPFGAGRRICVGMSLGLRMVQLLVATLVQAFDWELTNGIEPEKLNMDEFFGLNVQRAEPLMVHPRTRLAPHLYRSD